MPIVMPETACFPEDLLANPPDDFEGRRWRVAQTMARQEKSLARELARLEIPFYLPLVPRRLEYKGRRVVSYSPFFSGSVFLYATDEERRICLATRRVSSILEPHDQKELRDDLLRVEAMLNGKGTSDMCNSASLERLGIAMPRRHFAWAWEKREAGAVCGS
jgi:hypothetical protein